MSALSLTRVVDPTHVGMLTGVGNLTGAVGPTHVGMLTGVGRCRQSDRSRWSDTLGIQTGVGRCRQSDWCRRFDTCRYSDRCRQLSAVCQVSVGHTYKQRLFRLPPLSLSLPPPPPPVPPSIRLVLMFIPKVMGQIALPLKRIYMSFSLPPRITFCRKCTQIPPPEVFNPENVRQVKSIPARILLFAAHRLDACDRTSSQQGRLINGFYRSLHIGGTI